jgi:hypothetical protein
MDYTQEAQAQYGYGTGFRHRGLASRRGDL